MITFNKDAKHEALGKAPRQGMWNRNNGHIVLRCPVCKNTPSFDAHTIADDGTVSPSFVCTAPACTFHDFVKLENFTKAA
jgi:hypothetical protein